MKLFERIFAEPELRDEPPVLVDIGAAGGVHRLWRDIAKYSIGVGFEPDSREAAPIQAAQKQFKRWAFSPTLAWPGNPDPAGVRFHLTSSPQCSSVLVPDHAALQPWAFAEFFVVQREALLPAASFPGELARLGLRRVDWLKCDTQGLDLQLYHSLPDEVRRAVLAVEFEPGIIDAYRGETHVGDVLNAMAREPFWLAEFQVGRTARGNAAILSRELGTQAVRRVRRFGPPAPAWANLRWLRDVQGAGAALDRRSYLLSWVFATLCGQHAESLAIAVLGEERFDHELFADLRRHSRRRLQWRMALGLPAAVLRRLARA